jgi:hypothetical protein
VRKLPCNRELRWFGEPRSSALIEDGIPSSKRGIFYGRILQAVDAYLLVDVRFGKVKRAERRPSCLAPPAEFRGRPREVAYMYNRKLASYQSVRRPRHVTDTRDSARPINRKKDLGIGFGTQEKRLGIGRR